MDGLHSGNRCAVRSGIVPAEELTPNPAELRRRLAVPADAGFSVPESCYAALQDAMQPRYCFLESPVSVSDRSRVRTDFGTFESADLAKCLRGCDRFFLFAATLGIGTDRLIAKLSVSDKAKAYLTDALADAYAEALADTVSAGLKSLLPEKETLTARYSPGYGDLDLSVQLPVLTALCAEKNIGISLGNTFFMTPKKSVTAFQGVKAG